MPFINVHTHKKSIRDISLINCAGKFSELPVHGFYTVGIHPWYITAQTVHEFKELVQTAKQANVLAVGECGLDKVCKTDLALQQSYFINQIQLANALQKPLIIHCVRAYNEVVQILQEQKVQVPVVFHGFAKNAVLAAQLINKGYYLSFGKHLRNTPTAETFKALPLENLFLETDDSELAIEEIYQTSAAIKNIPIETLAKQVELNARRVFGEKIIVP